VVVLGAATSNLRFWEARHLFNWMASRTQGQSPNGGLESPGGPSLLIH
jgi:hypothetical protein